MDNKEMIENTEVSENKEVSDNKETGKQMKLFEGNPKLQNLIMQILKFGIVGGLSFVIDFIITLIVDSILRGAGLDMAITGAINSSLSLDLMPDAVSASVAGVFGFCISLIFNYIMSMKFVFERKEDMDRKKEFAIFAILSIFGLLLNTAIMYGGKIAAAKIIPVFAEEKKSVVTAIVKIIATAIVMVYNFISRKLTLEKKDK